MSETTTQLADCVEQVANFSGKNLALRISELEFRFTGPGRETIACAEDFRNADDQHAVLAIPI